MSTIPASKYVLVLPGVLSAGGSALQMLGICVTENSRVPMGEILSFASPVEVSTFFGPDSDEYNDSIVYFAGYDNKTASPAAMLFAQWPGGGVGAYLQSGKIVSVGLPTLKTFSGTLSVVMDGYLYDGGTFDLSAATSFSAAAAIIETALNGTVPTEASFTGSIAPGTAIFTASIAGEVMTVTAVASGLITAGSLITVGAASNTVVRSQLSGTQHGLGTYAVSISQVVASTSITATHGILTVTAVASGTISVGQSLAGAGITAYVNLVTELGTGQGLTGTYYTNHAQTVASEALTTVPNVIDVSFDPVAGAFLINTRTIGTAATAAFATGTLAPLLKLTQQTGAILSQGSYALLPGTFMNNIIAVTQNWATFYTLFDPDDGSGNAQKQLFSAWVNGTTDRFCYICWDSDITPTESNNAATCMGQLLRDASNSSGTCLIWEPDEITHHKAAFIAGMAASINFEAVNGRITFFGKHQTGLVAEVSDLTTASNLDANGYNYYGASATANQSFVFLNNGFISGPFQWVDTYINQIWMSNQFQLALMELLTTINAIPYNTVGYSMIEQACVSEIQAALRFGAIVSGINLSSSQILEINETAGLKIADVVTTQGWYFQVQPASPQIRQARQSPVCFFWYTDGGSVQKIVLNAIDVQ